LTYLSPNFFSSPSPQGRRGEEGREEEEEEEKEEEKEEEDQPYHAGS
jgi:hypothetical protein